MIEITNQVFKNLCFVRPGAGAEAAFIGAATLIQQGIITQVDLLYDCCLPSPAVNPDPLSDPL